MTIEAIARVREYLGNGSTVAFDTGFAFFAASDLRVYLRNGNGDEALQTLGASYTVSGGNGASGTVTFAIAPATGLTVVIRSRTAISQQAEYPDGGKFPAPTVERSFDRAAAIDQEQQDQIDDLGARAPLFPAGEVATVLPSAAQRGDRLLAFDSGPGAQYGVTPFTVSQLSSIIGAIFNPIFTQLSALVLYVAPGSSGASRSIEAKSREIVTLMDRAGADDSGATANDAALSAALTYAYSKANKPVRLTAGVYKFTGKQTITQGVALLGDGSQGSNEAYGTVLKHYSAGDFIEFNGAGASSAGTGGGLRDLLIVKADGYQGGTALKIVATGDSQRPGEMLVQNVLIYGVGSTPGAGGNGGLWDRCLVIDGSAANTNGSRGVRSFYGHKIRCAEAQVAGETVVLKQLTHAFFHGLQIDQGDSSAAQGLTIKGINENLNICEVDIFGSITIVANDASNANTALMIDGSIAGAFMNNDALATGNVTLTMSETGGFVVVNKSPKLSIRCNLSPRFVLTRNAPTSNDKTGDGTIYTVPFDTERYDRGNNFGAGPNNTYTCYCAGWHRLAASVMVAGLGSGHTRADISITRLGSETTVITKVVPLSNVAGGFYAVSIETELVLAYGDTVQVQIAVSGSTKTVGVYGDSTTYTSFSGEYIA